MGGFLGFAWNQWTFKPKPLAKDRSLEGTTVLITGGNVGLGLEAAKEIVSHRPNTLILAVRDVEKGQVAKDAIAKESTPPDVNLEVWELDYDSYDSITAFGSRVQALPRLDYVLLNAGLKQMQYTTAKLGHETNLQINHLGTSLVSLQVLPALIKTAKATSKPSRLTIVSSEGHFWIPFKERTAPNILARMDEKDAFGRQMSRYYTTKLLNVLWARELASKVEKRDVVVNAVNPGFCYSGLHRHEKTGIIKLFLWAFGWTTQQGGYCLVDALVQHGDSHGAYLSEQKVVPPSKFVLSEEGKIAQKKIWKETFEIFRKEAPKANISELESNV
ncbi:short-chain dehydrogenase/reductase SDR [Melanomma pulvis-pyrius CBS 109.77]|uniref:Short-chain dehydrogenase/reductase SDR n=1 Tax=Melanomma pulvis-pyrius CBS 109.77 TaxID=1314802 RepID=A0A6A6XIU0_9PLEO|nr:short-chain dehydrogenase/reductase SDR [Melanomma pulvis-pyrius CBS 109.77]